MTEQIIYRKSGNDSIIYRNELHKSCTDMDHSPLFSFLLFRSFSFALKKIIRISVKYTTY